MPRPKVRSVMEQRKLLKTSPDTTVAKAAKLMGVKRVGAIAVVDETGLLGIFTERDALVRVIAQGRDPLTTRVADVMTRAPHTIGPEEPFDAALAVMEKNGFRHLPVVENGQPLGIVSSRARLPELPMEAGGDD